MDLIDISRPLSPTTAVWPGDQPVDWRWTAQLEDGDSVNLGAIQLSTHAATHADAPYHVREEGGTTSQLSLSSFVGPAEVVEIEDEADAIRPRHVDSVDAPRVLFKTTASSLPTDTWPDSIVPLHPDAVSALAQSDTVLVGVDGPSVDPLDSTELPAHNALIDAGIVNLEGITVAGVEPGRYVLIALPLNIPDADAAPVRAVLSDDPLP